MNTNGPYHFCFLKGFKKKFTKDLCFKDAIIYFWYVTEFHVLFLSDYVSLKFDTATEIRTICYENILERIR